MRYWSYLAAKLSFSAGLVYVLLAAIPYLIPAPPLMMYGREDPFLHDLPTTFAVMAVWLIGAGLVYLSIWDQRRRCHVCLHRLVMPVETGSWGNMLTFGRPRTEWICPYGHGTLRISNLQITGSELPDWQPHRDMWEELESYDQLTK